MNYGPGFYDTGIMTINPPVVTPPYEDNPANGPIYPTLRAEDRRDGNEIAGVRLPDVRVPLRHVHGLGAAGGLDERRLRGLGTAHSVPTTKAERMASGRSASVDRGALPELHGLLLPGAAAVNDFVGERFMLPEDASA